MAPLFKSLYAAPEKAVSATAQELSQDSTQDVARFCRQCQQLCTDLKYPDPGSLKSLEVQSFLFHSLFDIQNLEYTSPLSYRRRVLKQLLFLIEDAFEDPDEDVGLYKFLFPVSSIHVWLGVSLDFIFTRRHRHELYGVILNRSVRRSRMTWCKPWPRCL